MSDPVQLYDEADKLKDEGKLDEAVAKLNESLQADPNYALAHSALAVVLQRLGRHDEAIEHARRVCEIEPNDPFSFTALSVTYQRASPARTTCNTSAWRRTRWSRAGCCKAGINESGGHRPQTTCSSGGGQCPPYV